MLRIRESSLTRADAENCMPIPTNPRHRIISNSDASSNLLQQVSHLEKGVLVLDICQLLAKKYKQSRTQNQVCPSWSEDTSPQNNHTTGSRSEAGEGRARRYSSSPQLCRVTILWWCCRLHVVIQKNRHMTAPCHSTATGTHLDNLDSAASLSWNQHVNDDDDLGITAALRGKGGRKFLRLNAFQV